MKTTTDPPPNYLAPLNALLCQSRERIKAGSVHEARTSHDEWCLIWKGGVCNCNPVVELIEIEPAPV
jgi:hypothetical protein